MGPTSGSGRTSRFRPVCRVKATGDAADGFWHRPQGRAAPGSKRKSMLRNRNVRSKLIAILAAPAPALLVLASTGVWDRRHTAQDSRTVHELASLAAEITPTVHALQD